MRKKLIVIFLNIIMFFPVFSEIPEYEFSLIKTISNGVEIGELSYREVAGGTVGVGHLNYNYEGDVVVIDDWTRRINYYDNNLVFSHFQENFSEEDRNRKAEFILPKLYYKISRDNNFYTYSYHNGLVCYSQNLDLKYSIPPDDLPENVTGRSGNFWICNEYVLFYSDDNNGRSVINQVGQFLSDEEIVDLQEEILQDSETMIDSEKIELIKRFINQENLFWGNDRLLTNSYTEFLQFRNFMHFHLSENEFYDSIEFLSPDFEESPVKALGADQNGNSYFITRLDENESQIIIFTQIGEALSTFKIPKDRHDRLTVLPSGNIIRMDTVFGELDEALAQEYQNQGIYIGPPCEGFEFWQIVNNWD